MWRQSFAVVVIGLLLQVNALAQFQGLEGGSAGARRQYVRSNNQARLQDQAAAGEEEDQLFTKVSDVESFVKAVRESRQRQVRRLYGERERVRVQKRIRAADRKNRIAAINAQIVELNRTNKTYLPELSTGKVRTLFTRFPEHPSSLYVVQVIDKTNAVVASSSRSDDDFWLTGFDTSTWADDRNANVEAIIVHTGTKSFATTDGAKRTLPLWQPLDLHPADERLSRRDDVRTWTTKDGKTQRGALVLYDTGRVTIMDVDGKKALLKLVDLTPADWDYVAAHAPAPERRK